MKISRLLILFAFLLTSCGLNAPQQTVTPTPIDTAQPLPQFTSTPLSAPEPTTLPVSGGLKVEVYPLESPPSTEPLTFTPTHGTQGQIQLIHQELRDQEPARRLFEANQALQPFGVNIKANWSTDPTVSGTYSITREGKPLFDQPVIDFTPVSVNASGNDFLMGVDTSNDSYLVRGTGVQKQTLAMQNIGFLRNQIIEAAEVYTNTSAGSLGWISVTLDGGEVFTTSVGSPTPVTALRGLWSDGTSWILEVARASDSSDTFQVLGEIFQNGISLNLKYGYQSSFEYQLLGGKPFYFFQKDGQIGVSYDGQETYLGFDDVQHYGCCSGAELNPREYSSLVDFFARNGEAWYFVEILGGN